MPAETMRCAHTLGVFTLSFFLTFFLSFLKKSLQHKYFMDRLGRETFHFLSVSIKQLKVTLTFLMKSVRGGIFM